MDYDLLVIGKERAGLERAISSAQGGERVVVVATPDPLVSLDVMRLAAFNVAENNEVTMAAWRTEVARLNRCQMLCDNSELESAGAERIEGHAHFVSPSTVEVREPDKCHTLSCREVVLACGTRSRLPVYLREDDRFVVSVETLLNLPDIPRSIIVVGAGESGLNAAIMLATLGVEVTVVDEHSTLLELCGLFEARFDAVQSLNIAFRLDDEVIGTELRPDMQAAARLASGRVLVADAVLVCVGKEGNTETLNLEAAGVGIDEHGRVWCDTHGQTWVPQITAVGEVIGFPQTGVVPPSHIHASAFEIARQAVITPRHELATYGV